MQPSWRQLPHVLGRLLWRQLLWLLLLLIRRLLLLRWLQLLRVRLLLWGLSAQRLVHRTLPSWLPRC